LIDRRRGAHECCQLRAMTRPRAPTRKRFVGRHDLACTHTRIEPTLRVRAVE
jgi:hypothetical protein